MLKNRIALFLTLALALVLVAPAFASFELPKTGIYISDCPQKCTATCPCSLPCTGPFGPTTCGQAGQACTVYLSDEVETQTPLLFDPRGFLFNQPTAVGESLNWIPAFSIR